MKAVFVYGSLKRGLENAALLAGQRFLGEARTAARYRMVDCGGYPGLVEAGDGGKGVAVTGEIWEVDEVCLAGLDVLEGIEEGLYWRGEVELVEEEGGEGLGVVEGYFWNRGVEGLLEVEGGDWGG